MWWRSLIKAGGHFYVEYSGTENQVELILQSLSGGSNWSKVSISESGSANGHYYAKFSYKIVLQHLAHQTSVHYLIKFM